MRDICFLKFGNTVQTGNCLKTALSQPSDRLYYGFVSCLCFEVRVPLFSSHLVEQQAHRIYTLYLNSVNQLIFVMVKCGVLFEVRTEFLNNI
jgi:hypothetical protein